MGHVRRILSSFPSIALQHLGLFIAFVLVLAAHEFAATHPALTAILVFIFSLPYLLASIVTRRASFLYGTMLLGAVAYFQACHALGAPRATFPLLSVPLVVCLELLGQYLRKRLGEDLASYPPTVFRAMNITVAVFAFWALAGVGDLLAGGGFLSYIAGLALFGYAGLYLAHCLAGSPAFYTYVFAGFLSLGGIFTVAALASARFCWMATMASATIIILVGTRFHSRRKYAFSRHFYFCSFGVIVLSLFLSVLSWPFLLINLALSSLLLWIGYQLLSRAVEPVRQATMAERVMAKCFFFAAMLLTVPVIPMLFTQPENIYVSLAALICGLTFSWIASQRSGQNSGWGNLYILAAVMFLSAALFGAARFLPLWSFLALLLLLLLTLAGLSAYFSRKTDELTAKNLGRAAIFPAFFCWYYPLLLGQTGLALTGAGVAIVAAVALGLGAKESFFCATGPAMAGALIAATLLLVGLAPLGWIICAIGAAAAAALLVWAQAKDKPVTRAAANIAWLILSVAAAVLAAMVASTHLLYSLTAVGFISALLAGRLRGQDRPGALDILVYLLTVLTVITAALLGPLSGQDAVLAGICLLILASAHWMAWVQNHFIWFVRSANALFALGSLMVIFGAFQSIEARLGTGAALLLILLALAAVMARRFPQASRSAALSAHLAGFVLASAAFSQAWSGNTWYLPLAIMPYVLLYALLPKLRTQTGVRVGAILWLSLAAMFCLAAYANTPYRLQMSLVALLSLIWMITGIALARSRNKSWPVPFYISAAILAGFCGVVSLFSPAVQGSWQVFLVNGIVFACLFIILRQDIFAYLITLSLSLLAYDWVKASTTSFTQDLLFYLVIGAAVLGLLFLLPHLRKFILRSVSLPIFSIFTWRGAAIICIPVLALALLVLSAYSVKISGHPKFCTSCHYMGDYYTSWQHSSHKDVACIDCHYEPGMTATVKGKMEGMVQLVKYVSHSYGTQPHAMISNASCTREGCHDKGMDQSRKTLLFRGKIRFRHDKHLGEHPRGKVLNCVSCHGQTVAGQHINVGETTCLTCHFYGRGEQAVAAGDCLTCHIEPQKTVTFMDHSFNHREFLEGKDSVHCSYCHSQVTHGDGAVSPTRCRSCHRGTMDQIKDQAQFHLVHVAKGHFDCLQCHDEIKHGIHPAEQQLLASGNCNSCHGGQRHSLQEKIYAGTAIPELQATPDAMYTASVACDGCHTDQQVSGFGTVPFTKKISGAKQCADCHGSKMYGQMLTSWQEETKERLAELEPALQRLDSIFGTAQESDEKLAQAGDLLESARTKLSYVIQDGSYGAHNITYVSAILDIAETEIRKCQALVAAANKPSLQEASR